jgi:hypothetical protein
MAEPSKTSVVKAVISAVAAEKKEERRAVYFTDLTIAEDAAVSAIVSASNVSRPEAFAQLYGFTRGAFDAKTALRGSIEAEKAKIAKLEAEYAKLK